MPSRPGTALALTAAVWTAGIARAGAQPPAEPVPTAIGDSARDLVFTPVPRCRVLDTRVAGGRLTAGIPRSFDVAGPLAGQGGAADCLVPFGPATAVVLNLQPVQPGGRGTLSAWAFGGPVPATTLLGFAPRPRTAGAANELILPICDPASAACTFDLTVQANGSDTHLVADVAGYYARADVSWAALSGMPAGFADGVDDDTQYTAGEGLVLDGTTFSMDDSVVQRRVATICASGSAIRAIGADGSVVCQTDANTTYTAAAGGGLTLAGTSFSVANGGITNAMLASGSVSADKIASNTITATQIASGAVGASEIATDGVGAAEIAANAVGQSEIATSAVGLAEVEGTEVGFYRENAFCGSALTFSATCTTVSCGVAFFSCTGSCGLPTAATCSNVLLGYLLSPSIN